MEAIGLKVVLSGINFLDGCCDIPDGGELLQCVHSIDAPKLLRTFQNRHEPQLCLFTGFVFYRISTDLVGTE